MRSPKSATTYYSVYFPRSRIVYVDLLISVKACRLSDWPRVTLVLYRRRAHEKVEVSAASRRAFDKAVRRKPLADAADAGLWKLNGAEDGIGGLPGRWAGATRRVAGR